MKELWQRALEKRQREQGFGFDASGNRFMHLWKRVLDARSSEPVVKRIQRKRGPRNGERECTAIRANGKKCRIDNCYLHDDEGRPVCGHHWTPLMNSGVKTYHRGAGS